MDNWPAAIIRIDVPSKLYSQGAIAKSLAATASLAWLLQLSACTSQTTSGHDLDPNTQHPMVFAVPLPAQTVRVAPIKIAGAEAIAQAQASILRPDPRCELYVRATLEVGRAGAPVDAAVINKLTDIMSAAVSAGCAKDEGGT